MPSGRTHTRFNLLSLPVVLFLLVSYGMTSREFLLWFAGGFVFGTYFLTPDLDTISSAYRNWGPLRIIWRPYRAVMPHRSFFTHTIVLGDVIRLLYLFVIFLPFLYLLNVQVLDGALPGFVRAHRPMLGVAVLGIFTTSALHIILDIVNTKRKRMFRTKRSRR